MAKLLLACLLSTVNALYYSTWKVEDCSEFASSLRNVGHKGATILNATHIPVGTAGISDTFNVIPICRLFGNVPYVGNNSVIFELWLPVTWKYNDRFLVVGNSGMAGVIDEGDVVRKINRGYAVAGGDGGHRAAENNGGIGAPGVYLPYMHDKEQVKAWQHNSIAYLTPVARAIVTAFYLKAPKHTYYEGCSTGGAQGFALAQFHPGLFDGIVAGCPGNWFSHLSLSWLWNSQVIRPSTILPQTTLNLITEAALEKCDAADGLKDGVLENPLSCDFDVSSLECRPSWTNSSACLTSAQIAVAQKIYRGPVDSRSNASLYPGFSVGGETEWLLQEGYLAQTFSTSMLQNMLFNNLSYNTAGFNWGTDVDALDVRMGTLIDEISPDLSALKASGAKMIVFQAWSDPIVAPKWPIQHLHEIEEFFGGNVSDWFRLFMIPGGGHCGPATNYPQVPGIWHALEALVQWVETGQAPKEMLGTDPEDLKLKTKTSKLCPWPQTAKYVGDDPNDWNSFECGE